MRPKVLLCFLITIAILDAARPPPPRPPRYYSPPRLPPPRPGTWFPFGATPALSYRPPSTIGYRPPPTYYNPPSTESPFLQSTTESDPPTMRSTYHYLTTMKTSNPHFAPTTMRPPSIYQPPMQPLPYGTAYPNQPPPVWYPPPGYNQPPVSYPGGYLRLYAGKLSVKKYKVIINNKYIFVQRPYGHHYGHGHYDLSYSSKIVDIDDYEDRNTTKRPVYTEPLPTPSTIVNVDIKNTTLY